MGEDHDVNKCPNTAKLDEVRTDHYNYKEEQIKLNEWYKGGMKVADTIPSLRKQVWITTGLLTFVGLVMIWNFAGLVRADNKITDNKDHHTSLENTVTTVTSDIGHMKEDIKDIKESQKAQKQMFQTILERLPGG